MVRLQFSLTCRNGHKDVVLMIFFMAWIFNVVLFYYSSFYFLVAPQFNMDFMPFWFGSFFDGYEP